MHAKALSEVCWPLSAVHSAQDLYGCCASVEWHCMKQKVPAQCALSVKGPAVLHVTLSFHRQVLGLHFWQAFTERGGVKLYLVLCQEADKVFLARFLQDCEVAPVDDF